MKSKKAIAVLGVTALAIATVLGACGKAKVSSSKKSEGVTASGNASSSSSEKDLEPSDSAKDAVGGFDDTNSGD